MHTNTDEKKKIPLGSGNIYCVPYTGIIPEDSEFESEGNRLGHISGGASIEYKPTFYTATDDFRRVSKTVVTDEEATMKFGIITWNLAVLNRLIASGKITEKDGKRTLKIGGAENQNSDKYLFRFVNKDKVDGDTRVTMLGNNQAGLSLSYSKDKEVSVNPEIKGEPMADGAIIVIEEEVLTPSGI